MSKCILAPRVVADVDDIALFTAERWGEKQAVKYVRELQERFVWLAANPKAGRVRDDVRPGLRCFRLVAHMIFYEISSDGIVVVGVPHASADFDAYFEG